MKIEITKGGWLIGTIKELENYLFEVRLANASKFDEREIFETFGEAAEFMNNMFDQMIYEMNNAD